MTKEQIIARRDARVKKALVDYYKSFKPHYHSSEYGSLIGAFPSMHSSELGDVVGYVGGTTIDHWSFEEPFVVSKGIPVRGLA